MDLQRVDLLPPVADLTRLRVHFETASPTLRPVWLAFAQNSWKLDRSPLSVLVLVGISDWFVVLRVCAGAVASAALPLSYAPKLLLDWQMAAITSTLAPFR